MASERRTTLDKFQGLIPFSGQCITHFEIKGVPNSRLANQQLMLCISLFGTTSISPNNRDPRNVSKEAL